MRTRAFGEADSEFRPGRSTAPAHLLFALLTPLYLLFQLATRTRFILGGEMFAEMSAVYYGNAQSPSPWVKLLSTDAGYIPLPQRVIGALGDALGLPVGAVPYYYTFSALILSALIVGVIVLPVFRAVIPSDALRFLVACAMLLVVDFETRTYLNFTCFAVVPFVFLAGLALAAPGGAAPVWIWLAPVFAISKPTVLAALPAFIVAGIGARGHYRPVAVTTAIAGALQVVRLAISAQTGATPLQSDTGSSPGDLLASAGTYALGFIGRVALNPAAPVDREALVAGGGIVLVGFLTLLLFGRSRSSALIPPSLAVIACSMLLNASSFADLYTPDGALLDVAVLDRRNLPAIVGVMTALATVAAVCSSPVGIGHVRRALRRAGPHPSPAGAPSAALFVGPLLFATWFVSVGWLSYATAVNQPLPASIADVHQWEDLAPAMSDPSATVCIPVAPLGWPVSGRGCRTLIGMAPFAPVSYVGVGGAESSPRTPLGSDGSLGSGVAQDVVVPPAVTTSDLGAVAVLVRPLTSTSSVSATLRLTTEDGRSHVLQAQDDLPVSGGVLLFGHHPVEFLPRVVAAEISFDAPVEMGWTPSDDGTQVLAGLWMGR